MPISATDDAHVRLTVQDIGVGHILEFRDPDDIALELHAPAAAPQV